MTVRAGPQEVDSAHGFLEAQSVTGRYGVGFVSGGEPIDGCDAVTLLIVGASAEEMESRARDLGVWDPSVWDDMRIRPRDVALAVADPSGFVWKPGHEREWRGSGSWPTAR
ncbi:hypothetical protein GCM10022215_16390 [Nocardioides fonticola]|uniref:YCII-related domain-containing protein n=1 Tax=Nocardioides fonticola TaxID=450363 RepID=A0ABP7XH29_9ACTN